MYDFIPCNFNLEHHRTSFLSLLREYMLDPMGNTPPLTDEKEEELIELLKNHASAFVYFAVIKGQIIAMTTCFVNIATFHAKKYINIHDIIVSHPYRGKGVGEGLLNNIINLGKQWGCVRINLEVRNDNLQAQQLYSKIGFNECTPPMHFLTKYL